jgi:poly(3-hydroxybutyrate) depolymerase
MSPRTVLAVATLLARSILASNTTITVSGLSGGAYMAVQYHVAFSASVSGVGVLAGSRWGVDQSPD